MKFFRCGFLGVDEYLSLRGTHDGLQGAVPPTKLCRFMISTSWAHSKAFIPQGSRLHHLPANATNKGENEGGPIRWV